jgi:release factor glutamine methyltransferase
MMLGAALRQAQSAIAAGSDSARLDAELLLGHVLGCSRTQLMTRRDLKLPEVAVRQFANLVERRCAGEPVAYLIGTQGFWSLDLRVSPAVLIPRPETELLVEWALEGIPADAPARIADLGTGSGAIALAIAKERPLAQVTATDCSAGALAVARDNAARAGLAATFREGDWWGALAAARFDLIVSNPPYIARDDAHLPALRYEPPLALSDGADGLQALRIIIGGARDHLHDGGRLLVEHGYDQGPAVRALFAGAGFRDIGTRRDLEGRERASGGRLP